MYDKSIDELTLEDFEGRYKFILNSRELRLIINNNGSFKIQEIDENKIIKSGKILLEFNKDKNELYANFGNIEGKLSKSDNTGFSMIFLNKDEFQTPRPWTLNFYKIEGLDITKIGY